MNFIADAFQLLTGPDAPEFARRTGEHLAYSALSLAIALLIGLPLGLWLGHRRTGSSVVLAVAGALRALPTLGLLTYLTATLSFGIRMPLIPTVIVLLILGVPPVLANAFSGIATIDPVTVDAARATGFTEADILRRVELPLAAPTIVGGVRSANTQVIASTTVAAYIGLGGLGRPILDGLASQDYARMVAASLVIIVASLAIDVLLAVLQRSVRPTTRSNRKTTHA